jgi:L-seryl-tRNA(Ser) seleniumtransferase
MNYHSPLNAIITNLKLHQDYDLHKIINARGVFTPLGVSRSPKEVADAVSYALQNYFVIDELMDIADEALSRISGLEAGAVTHCAAAAITLAVAAVMSGEDRAKVAQLPDTTGMPNLVVIQAGHLVNYGNPIEQAIRLSGAGIITAGDAKMCGPQQLAQALSEENVACMVYVDSRLCQGDMVDLQMAVELSHSLSKPVIVDAAAQDLRLDEVAQAGGDLCIFSAQKYLAGPTAGIVVGKRDLVNAIRTQEQGIGRTMKPSKEAIIGTLAALSYRENTDLQAWKRDRQRDAEAFSDCLNRIEGISAQTVPDPTKGPFSRIHCKIDEKFLGRSTPEIADNLRSGQPPIYVFENLVTDNVLVLEILDLDADERTTILSRLSEILAIK